MRGVMYLIGGSRDAVASGGSAVTIIIPGVDSGVPGTVVMIMPSVVLVSGSAGGPMTVVPGWGASPMNVVKVTGPDSAVPGGPVVDALIVRASELTVIVDPGVGTGAPLEVLVNIEGGSPIRVVLIIPPELGTPMRYSSTVLVPVALMIDVKPDAPEGRVVMRNVISLGGPVIDAVMIGALEVTTKVFVLPLVVGKNNDNGWVGFTLVTTVGSGRPGRPTMYSSTVFVPVALIIDV